MYKLFEDYTVDARIDSDQVKKSKEIWDEAKEAVIRWLTSFGHNKEELLHMLENHYRVKCKGCNVWNKYADIKENDPEKYEIWKSAFISTLENEYPNKDKYYLGNK